MIKGLQTPTQGAQEHLPLHPELEHHLLEVETHLMEPFGPQEGSSFS